ncbi:MAG: twin-arginine translocation signal domain-containing protein [Magnetococcales bacterium]|nr:twin-arginine translocation signal domain-containing protein [Magnetococcales bacterium]
MYGDKNQDKQRGLTRRDVFRGAGVAGVACAGGLLAWSRSAQAAAVDDAIVEKMGAGALTEGKIELGAPDKAENGTLVRIPVVVNHPQEPGSYIDYAAVFVDNNPKPFVAGFSFLPESGKVEFEVRIKMAQASNVRVVARNNKGQRFSVMKKVDVAEGGCA